jgi:hypothetical protein
VRKGKHNAFFKRAGFKVKQPRRPDTKPKPKIEIDDETQFYAVKLAKLGYYKGDPDAVLAAPITTVLSILDYEVFENDLVAAYSELEGGAA